MTQQRKKITAQAEKTIAFWVSTLRLRDWQLDIDLVNSKQMEEVSGSETALGYCVPNTPRKYAHIYLLRPNDKAYEGEPTDFEDTIVHELLHLHFAIVPEEFVLFEEQSVCAIAGALVHLRKNQNERTRPDSHHPKGDQTRIEQLKGCIPPPSQEPEGVIPACH